MEVTLYGVAVTTHLICLKGYIVAQLRLVLMKYDTIGVGNLNKNTGVRASKYTIETCCTPKLAYSYSFTPVLYDNSTLTTACRFTKSNH